MKILHLYEISLLNISYFFISNIFKKQINFTIEYNFQNINNFYFNNGLILSRDNFTSTNKSNDIIDQNKELYSIRNDEFQKYENLI